MRICELKIFLCSLIILASSCAGMKVVNPNDQNTEAGTMALETYTCTIVASNGNRVKAVAKTESEAQKEALAKCRDQTVISFCEPKNLKCVKN